jgi:hypothetical protein
MARIIDRDSIEVAMTEAETKLAEKIDGVLFVSYSWSDHRQFLYYDKNVIFDPAVIVAMVNLGITNYTDYMMQQANQINRMNEGRPTGG